MVTADGMFEALVAAGFSKRDAGLFAEGALDMARQLAAQLDVPLEDAAREIAEGAWKIHNGASALDVREDIEARLGGSTPHPANPSP